MAMRSTIISRSLPLHHCKHPSNSRLLRFFSDQGKVLDDEERARENLYVKVSSLAYSLKKMEKEKMEKQKQKVEGKDKDDKDKFEKKP